jgi:nitroimidazol reductase NimA-like FMN-containing flavoprotein (pyridoxamine 5'-phosphate oxidase superfamily)
MSKPIIPIKSNAECEKIIQGTFQGVLCMAENNEPYALPINHAYRDGKFYFHCAASGKKLDVINANPNVTYIISKYYGDPEHFKDSLKCHGFWESVIVYGKARVITDVEELNSTFRTFMAYYGNEDFTPGEHTFETTRAIVIEVEKMTARREYEDHKADYWYWEKSS